MSHFLLRKTKNRSPEEAKGRRVLQHNKYIGEVFVGRRKVWEGRYETESEANAAAHHIQESKYKDTNSDIQIRKAKAKGDA